MQGTLRLRDIGMMRDMSFPEIFSEYVALGSSARTSTCTGMGEWLRTPHMVALYLNAPTQSDINILVSGWRAWTAWV
ncbi:hypothetical protein A0H81_05909 [Grifola frondosa]|uniref:Uncharacterized protein n=1 Tax=Grifola frondosa TaxID=5627 RepID=A0A1C7MG19_GRIFR|nr:hypothetical protein A0H81_05909 [Grifola frondosa]